MGNQNLIPKNARGVVTRDALLLYLKGLDVIYKFDINGIEWKVKYINSDNDLLMRKDGSITLGMTDRNMRTVFLSNRLQGRLLKKVLTHEICHCCIFSYGIYLTLEQEEYLCDFVATHAQEILNLANEFCTPVGSDLKNQKSCK